MVLFEVQSFSANGTTVNKKQHYFQIQRKIKDSKFLILIIEQMRRLFMGHLDPIIHKLFEFLATECKKLLLILQYADITTPLTCINAQSTSFHYENQH